MNTPTVTVGLYRHFKGAYYYVTGLSKNAIDDTVVVNYFNVCHPEYGSFVRPLDDFVADRDQRQIPYGSSLGECIIKDRKDNTTGQHLRFERVKDLNFQLRSVSTESLIEELRNRTDSPIHELDIEELQSKIFFKDYVVGEVCEETLDTPKGVYTITSFDKEEDAYRFLASHKVRKGSRVFKRVFIEV